MNAPNSPTISSTRRWTSYGKPVTSSASTSAPAADTRSGWPLRNAPPPRSAVNSSRRFGSYTAATSPTPSISSASDEQKIGRPWAKLVVPSIGSKTQQGPAVPAGPCWVFDPIDGTTNFAHGLPIFCSSLALEIDGVGEVAAVYDPNRRELFTAERGGGAFLNGQPLRVSAAGALVDALLVTGFPYDVHRRVDEIVGLFGAFIGEARGVRRLGSAAIDLCYVAAGRVDGFWESDLKPWDIAGGALI